MSPVRRPPRVNLLRCLSDRQPLGWRSAKAPLRILEVVLVVLVLVTAFLPTPTVAQHDPFQSLSDETAQELVDLLGRVEAAEGAENWVVALRLYREMWQVLPVDEYRFGEAYCLEQLGDTLGAVAVLEALVRSPRDEVREAATRQIEPLRLELATASAMNSVGWGHDEGALAASTAATAPPPTVVEPAERPIWPPFVLGGLAMIALGNGVVFGVLSELRADDAQNYDETQPGATYLAVKQLNDDAEDYATIANGSFAVAGVLAVSAVLIWIFSAPDADEAHVEVMAAPAWVAGSPGAVIQWQF